MARRLLFFLIVLASMGTACAQVVPEYGIILRGGGKPGPVGFPDLSQTPRNQAAPARQPVGDIAFLHRGDIYTVTLDGRYMRRLTSDGKNAFPIWSRDGRYIAFTKEKPWNGGGTGAPPMGALWIITSDGRYSKEIASSKYESLQPVAWLPDGKGILVARHYLESDVTETLEVVMLDGKPYSRMPAWMKAGEKAGFVQQFPDKRLFSNGGAGDFTGDGKELVFSGATEWRVDAPRLDIYKMGVGGTNLRRLTILRDSVVSCLRVNPANGRILTCEMRIPNPETAAYYLRDSKGNVVKRLAAANWPSFAGIDWSPKGDYIIYQVTSPGYTSEYPGDFGSMSKHSSLWVMKADGTGAYKMASDACHPNWR